MIPEQKVLLKATNIFKSFHYPVTVPILKGLNLTVISGTSIAIMGRSGEGKSTLLQILGTLDTPCKGSIEIVGQELNHFNRNQIRNKHIAFVFQSFFLLEDYTALENVLVPARIARKAVHKGSTMWNYGMHLLEKVGMADRAHFRSKMLSGGEKQRVGIARALCNDPDLIFADEPSGNLDRDSAEIIHTMLLDFAKNPSKGLVVVTHDTELAKLCNLSYQLLNGVLLLPEKSATSY